MTTGASSTSAEPLLERERELRALAGLLAGARACRGGLLVLEAAAGLGKSTLVERAAELAAGEGFVVLRAAGRELEQQLGWGVARSLFESWLLGRDTDERDELLAGAAAPCAVLFEPANAALAPGPAELSFGILHGLHWLAVRVAERRPLLLVVDDAHWADQPSLRFVLYLAGRVREQAIAVLVATRGGKSDQDRLLEHLHGDPAATVCELAPLGAMAVAALVQRRLAAADERFCRRCFELTKGNPLLVRELVSASVLDEPSGGCGDLDASAERAARSLSRSVLRRLGALSAGAQALAGAVAVFEGGVPLHRAGALAGEGPLEAFAAADELARADILDGGDPLGFVHPLVRAAVYGGLSRPERANTHRRAARMLADEGAPSEQVGAHLLEAPAGRDTGVVEGLRHAARSAMAHGVPASAIAYLERALREPPSDDVRSAVLAELGRAEQVAGRRDAVAHLQAAIELADDPRRRARLRLELGRTLHDFGRPADACAACEAGLAELDAGAAALERELALELEATYLTSAVIVPERAPDAHRRVDAILANAPSAPTRAARTLLSKAMIMRVYADGHRDELAALARRLLADGRLVEEDGVGSQALAHAVITLSSCDDYEAAEQALALGFVEIRRRGWTTWGAAFAQLRARQRIWTGPIADAVEDARSAVEIFASGMQMYLPSAACVLVRGLLEHDEPDEAAAVLARLDSGRAAVGPFAAWRDEALARVAADRGEHDRALQAFLACGQHATRVLLINPGLFHWRSQAGLAALRTGDRELAQRLIAEEQHLADAFGAPRAIGVAMRAAATLERGEAAVELLRSAAAILAGCGARVEHAHALAELGGAVRRAGRPSEARAVLREAIRVAEPLGAHAAARRARAELALAGGRARIPEDAASDRLTPSERRVAELAAAGRTNREIAGELFVTVKAVEWHLGNAYRKLDIRRRAQLAGALAARPGNPA